MSAQGVRLQVGPGDEALDGVAVVELQAALSAWLHTAQPLAVRRGEERGRSPGASTLAAT
ncbi:hypothetical protein VO63_22285 [Streptomyces showdoensis]|uniref:Uncharacterized protein n=1 Tax=Streptomyces showdoensis TaxID=68268 RepID=A0A2P2GLN9_STREW|nr:hypothetical protein VO63_22285 [Streptomyces showdoensis]